MRTRWCYLCLCLSCFFLWFNGKKWIMWGGWESWWKLRVWYLGVVMLPLSFFSDRQREQPLLPTGETELVSTQPKQLGPEIRCRIFLLAQQPVPFQLVQPTWVGDIGDREWTSALFPTVEADHKDRLRGACVLLSLWERRTISEAVLWVEKRESSGQRPPGCKSCPFGDSKSLGKLHHIRAK